MTMSPSKNDEVNGAECVEDVSASTLEILSPGSPMSWPAWKRNTQILMVAFHSMVSVFMAAGLIPGFQAMAAEYAISVPQASYLTSIQILVLGIAPFFWNPITARYGRYHIFMFSVLSTMACNIGGAFCTSFGAQMATRALAAWLISPPLGIGSGVVTELCLPEERAKKLGWWTLLTTLGIPGGAFINGFVVEHLGVAWIYWIFAIINGVQLIAYVLLGDETLQVSAMDAAPNPASRSSRFVPHRVDARPLRVTDFIAPFGLLRLPRILVPAIAYSIEFAYANIAVVVETPLVFGEKFHFNAQQIGYQFVPIIIGSIIGEQLSGPMSDWFLKTLRRRKGHTIAADRLWLSYIGYGTVVAGLLVWGFQLDKAVHWNATPGVGMALAAFGNQVLTTTLISFAVDSHKEYSASIGVVINFCRQIYGFCGPFYFPTMFATLGMGGAAGVMCGIIVIVSCLPTLLMQAIDSRSKGGLHQRSGLP